MQRPITVLANDHRSGFPGSKVLVKGGTARFSIELRGYLVERGAHWVGLVGVSKIKGNSLLYKDPCGSWEISQVLTPHVDLKEVMQKSPRTTSAARQWAAEDLRNIEKVFDEKKPDVVFLNGYYSYPWMLLEVAVARNIPVVIQHAGIFIVEVRQYGDLLTENGRRFCHSIERETATVADANVFLNDFSRSAFIRNLNLKKPVRGSTVIPLPHAGWGFRPGHLGPIAREARAIGVVARWDRIKNMDAVLAFAEEVHRRKLPWKIRAVTTVPDTPLRAEFKARFRAAIEVVAPMGRDELQKFYESCDAMILPSHFDVSPTVVMEAAATGTPTAISPNVGWVSEYNTCGMSEWILDFSKPKKSVDFLERQFARTRWPELERFVKTVRVRHDPRKVYGAYLKLFRKLANQSRKVVTRKS